jgi:hypothetical protein
MTAKHDLANTILAEHADEIRRLGKRVANDVIEIGKRLSECRTILKEDGRWRAWLESELRLSPQTAGRFIQVYERRSNLEHIDLPISALYLLAAPSTPKEAADTIIERAQTGETVSVAEMKRIIGGTKGRAQPARKARNATTKRQPNAKPTEADQEARDDISPPSDAEVALKPSHERAARKLLNDFDQAPGEVQRHFLQLTCNDIGPTCTQELARKDAEIEKLRNAKHRLEIENTGLRSEIEELKTERKPASDSKAASRCSICHEKKQAALRPVFICDRCVATFEVHEAAEQERVR